MRSRNLKPSLFKNELLAVEDPLFTLIFQGLWCMADRDGRLEDRPAKIHLEINPGRAFQTTVAALEWLAKNVFIDRYEVAKQKFIQVVNFAKHQNPHIREPESKIPPKTTLTNNEPGARHDLGSAENSSGPADSLFSDSPFLIPDSGSLIPESVCIGERATQKLVREHIQAIKGNYPKGARENWMAAEHLIRRLAEKGEAWSGMVLGVMRYATHCKATGRRVMNPANFFGAVDKPWTQEWAIPPMPRRVTKFEQFSAPPDSEAHKDQGFG